MLTSDVLETANALLMRMYEELGTQLALQYGGSQAVGTPNSNAAKDFLQSVKRFYRNTFSDFEKQQIMDIFLGVFTPGVGPHIWDLESDLHLHNRPPPHFYQPLFPERAGEDEEEEEDEGGAAAVGGSASMADVPLFSRKEGASAAASRPPAASFDDYYDTSNYTWFDELLARSYVQTSVSTPRLAAHAATPAAAATQADEVNPASRDAPAGWLGEAADGTSVDHPLWEAAVTWERQVEYCAFHETIEARTVGSSLRVLLPRDYVECDVWHGESNSQHEPGLEWHEAMQAEALFPVVDENFYRNYTASAAWGD